MAILTNKEDPVTLHSTTPPKDKTSVWFNTTNKYFYYYDVDRDAWIASNGIEECDVIELSSHPYEAYERAMSIL